MGSLRRRIELFGRCRHTEGQEKTNVLEVSSRGKPSKALKANDAACFLLCSCHSDQAEVSEFSLSGLRAPILGGEWSVRGADQSNTLRIPAAVEVSQTNAGSDVNASTGFPFLTIKTSF